MSAHDDLAHRRILARTPIPPDEKHQGWFKYLVCPVRDQRSEWERANYCAVDRGDDGSLRYISFAHHKIIRFPTIGRAA